MTKKQYTIYGFIGLIIGIIGGIAGTAFSMGAEQQRISDALISNDAKMVALQLQQTQHQIDVNREMDNYAQIMAAQTVALHNSIRELTNIVSHLRTDVQVLKAIMERMEKDVVYLKEKSNLD